MSIIESKKQEVASLVSKIKESKAVIAFKYQGLTVEKFMQLRRSMRKENCEIKIIKNNISRRAVSECGFEDMTDALIGPVALIFSSEDIIKPAKQIFEFAKDNNVVEVIKGIIDNEVYPFSKLEALSQLPSYETLLTQLAAGMLGTVRQLAVGLHMLTEKQEA